MLPCQKQSSLGDEAQVTFLSNNVKIELSKHRKEQWSLLFLNIDKDNLSLGKSKNVSTSKTNQEITQSKVLPVLSLSIIKDRVLCQFPGKEVVNQRHPFITWHFNRQHSRKHQKLFRKSSRIGTNSFNFRKAASPDFITNKQVEYHKNILNIAINIP